MNRSFQSLATARCLTLAAILLLNPTVHATAGSPGTLDPFWGTGPSSPRPGIVLTLNGSGSAVAVQPDGKVVVAGACAGAGTLYDFCTLRYKPDGTLDESFNVTGKVVTTTAPNGGSAAVVVVQADGKIVLAGKCSSAANGDPSLLYDFCAVRYHSNGALDLSFNGTGKLIWVLGRDRFTGANALAVQPDGKLLLAGGCKSGLSYASCILRYNANGTPDISFNGTGSVTSAAVGASALVLQPDGKLVIAGGCHNGTNTDFCARRYNSDGSPDLPFGGSNTGIVITAIGGDSENATALVLQSDGKLVLAGYCHAAGTTFDFFCAQRLLADGRLDPSFGNPANGAVIELDSFTPDRVDQAQAISVQPDGKLVLVGTCGRFNNEVFCMLRYHGDGRLDMSFGNAGKVVADRVFGAGRDFIRALVLQGDGKMLLTGYCSHSSFNYLCTMRYDGGPFGYQNCKPDIDGDGRMTATIDGLINMRVMLGITGPAVINGITFPANATRNTWPLIRDYLVTQCGLSLVQ